MKYLTAPVKNAKSAHPAHPIPGSIRVRPSLFEPEHFRYMQKMCRLIVFAHMFSPPYTVFTIPAGPKSVCRLSNIAYG